MSDLRRYRCKRVGMRAAGVMDSHESGQPPNLNKGGAVRGSEPPPGRLRAPCERHRRRREFPAGKSAGKSADLVPRDGTGNAFRPIVSRTKSAKFPSATSRE